jgi:hypothetical protein
MSLEDGLAEVAQVMDTLGPKVVETPELKTQAHNILDAMRVAERAKSASAPTLFSQFGGTRVTPKKGGCSCP